MSISISSYQQLKGDGFIPKTDKALKEIQEMTDRNRQSVEELRELVQIVSENQQPVTQLVEKLGDMEKQLDDVIGLLGKAIKLYVRVNPTAVESDPSLSQFLQTHVVKNKPHSTDSMICLGSQAESESQAQKNVRDTGLAGTVLPRKKVRMILLPSSPTLSTGSVKGDQQTSGANSVFGDATNTQRSEEVLPVEKQVQNEERSAKNVNATHYFSADDDDLSCKSDARENGSVSSNDSAEDGGLNKIAITGAKILLKDPKSEGIAPIGKSDVLITKVSDAFTLTFTAQQGHRTVWIKSKADVNSIAGRPNSIKITCYENSHYTGLKTLVIIFDGAEDVDNIQWFFGFE